MSLQLNTPPAAEPVTLSQAKAWLRVESGDDEDALITRLIGAARARAEWHTGRAFVTQGWTLWLDGIGDGNVALPLPPLVAVTSVTLHGTDDGATVLDAAGYQVDAPGGRLVFAAPHPGLRAVNGVSIAFTAGYGDAASVPAPVRTAILQTIAWLYDHRGGDGLPDAALALLAPYRAVRL